MPDHFHGIIKYLPAYVREAHEPPVHYHNKKYMTQITSRNPQLIISGIYYIFYMEIMGTP